MRVLVQLAFEEGDEARPVTLAFADGSSLELTPEAAAAHVELERFTRAPPARAPAARPQKDEP